MNAVTQPQASIKNSHLLFIGGKWQKPASNGKLNVISPVTEQVIMTLPEAIDGRRRRAVAAARKAFDTGPWPRMSAAGAWQRAAQGGELLQGAHARAGRKPGRPRSARRSASRQYLSGQPPELFEYYGKLIQSYPFIDERTARGRQAGPRGQGAGRRRRRHHAVERAARAARLQGRGGAGRRLHDRRKPSPETPIDAHILAECIEAGGLAARACSTCCRRAARSATISSAIPASTRSASRASTAAGKHIAASRPSASRASSFELGGKSAAMILDDADIGHVLQEPRALFHADHRPGLLLADARAGAQEAQGRVRRRLYGAVSKVKVGDPFEADDAWARSTMQRQLDRVQGYIEKGKRRGRQARARRRPAGGLDSRLLRRADGVHRRRAEHDDLQEEIFGPVVSFIDYDR